MPPELRAPTIDDLFRLIRSLLARRWVRFGIVGGVATLVYFCCGLFLVMLCGLPALVGNALAYIISFGISYLGQSLWTFEAGDGAHRSMLPRFAATQAFGLALNSCIIWLLMRLGLAYEWAMPVAIALVPVVVYLICKYWVFRRRGGPAREVRP